MIDLSKKLIIIGGKQYEITAFQVWWKIDGLGLFPNIEDVKLKIEDLKDVSMHPTPVAVSEEGVFEEL